MSINADKPHRWKADIAASVDLFNEWFLAFAPKAYRETRLDTTKQVEEGLVLTHDLTAITPEVLKQHPRILPILRRATCPPLARDRLVGLAGANKSLVLAMESGRMAVRMPAIALNENLEHVCGTVKKMLDVDVFPWLEGGTIPRLDHCCRPALRCGLRSYRSQCPGEAPIGVDRRLPGEERLPAEAAPGQ